MKFKKGNKVIKLPLDNPADAVVISVTRADKTHVYCSDGNKYAQSNGRCSGRCVLGKKDTIQLPPFGYSAEEESERLRNIARRNLEIEQELSEYKQKEKLRQAEEQTQIALETFRIHQANWKQGRRIKTQLGGIRLVTLTVPGKFCGESVTNVLMVLLSKTTGKTGYVAYGSILSGIESSLHDAPLMRLFSIEASGKTKSEAIGALFCVLLSKTD